MKLDHIMYAAPDLSKGIDHIESLTGLRAAAGGQHPGQGTRNALLSLGPDQFLEIIAPDPAQVVEGTFGHSLAGLEQAYVRTWAVATSDFSALASACHQFGFRHRTVAMSRTRPDGVELHWRLLFVGDHPFDLALPFFIDWGDCPNPARSSPTGLSLQSFQVSCPNASLFKRFAKLIALDVSIETGNLEFQVALQTPSGVVRLT